MRNATLFAISLLALTFTLPPAARAAAKRQVLPNAIVKSVSATSVTVDANGKDMTFTVDPKTKVVGKGIGTKSAAQAGKPRITDLLKEGDHVTVTYHDMGGTMHASRIEVAGSPSK
jgi:hypothetical protein